MKHIVVMTIVGAALAGCSNLNLGALTAVWKKPQPEVTTPALEAPLSVESGELRPISRPITEVASETGSASENPSASSKAVTNVPLGMTVASLGNPAETGLWLKTPLVKVQQQGRVIYNGKTANVVLIPLDGEATAGSRMSLQAFQALGAPLTDLVTVNVAL